MSNFVSARVLPVLRGRVVAIGDIHGNLDNLLRLWSKLESNVEDFQNTSVVFLGDYVDRGPKSKETVEWLTELAAARKNTYFVAGNHDFSFASLFHLLPHSQQDFTAQLGVITGGRMANSQLLSTTHMQGVRYLMPGHFNCEQTFRSYGCEFGDVEGMKAAIPPHHKEFFSALPFIVEHEQYIFVHGGLRDFGELKEWQGLGGQELVELLKQRDISRAFIEPLQNRHFPDQSCPGLEGKTFVVGHVAVPEVRFEEHYIRCDTSGGWTTRPISAVLLPEKRVFTSDM